MVASNTLIRVFFLLFVGCFGVRISRRAGGGRSDDRVVESDVSATPGPKSLAPVWTVGRSRFMCIRKWQKRKTFTAIQTAGLYCLVEIDDIFEGKGKKGLKPRRDDYKLYASLTLTKCQSNVAPTRMKVCRMKGKVERRIGYESTRTLLPKACFSMTGGTSKGVPIVKAAIPLKECQRLQLMEPNDSEGLWTNFKDLPSVGLNGSPSGQRSQRGASPFGELSPSRGASRFKPVLTPVASADEEDEEPPSFGFWEEEVEESEDVDSPSFGFGEESEDVDFDFDEYLNYMLPRQYHDEST